jgi:hypothetical protein
MQSDSNLDARKNPFKNSWWRRSVPYFQMKVRLEYLFTGFLPIRGPHSTSMVDVVEEHLLTVPASNSSTSPTRVRLDIYIPTQSLAVEYQGEQHYADTSGYQGSSTAESDATKAAACRLEGIQLITVPYTWNGSIEQVKSLIDGK